MDRVCQIEKQYTFQIISQDKKSTTYTRIMFKVVKEMETSSNKHISQEYGKRISTMSAFQRGQGWGSAVCVLLLKKGGIDQKG